MTKLKKAYRTQYHRTFTSLGKAVTLDSGRHQERAAAVLPDTRNSRTSVSSEPTNSCCLPFIIAIHNEVYSILDIEVVVKPWRSDQEYKAPSP